MPWADAGYTESITGKVVTDAQLAQAQGVIDLYSNVTPAASASVGARDRGHLEMAVAYQAAWMAAQVDVFTRTDVAAIDQDGVRVTRGHPDAWQLAHLARLALTRLSWMCSRSVSLRPPGGGGPGARGASTRDARVVDRDGETWEPL